MKNLIKKSHLSINLDYLIRNFLYIQKITKGSQVIGVVKGDGYGHGMIKCSEALTSFFFTRVLLQ